MKRTTALASLSRDHHVALVIASTLSKAREGETEAAATRFVQFLAEHEVRHFALEESVLLPALKDDGRGRAFAERVLADHARLRDACARLQSSAELASVDFLHSVGALLRDHVRMEERELFPYLESSLEPSALEEIGEALTRG